MPHIHPEFDFVVSVFIVYRRKVLLVHHKSYGEWLPIGGHIELNEDPEEALYREIKEECGLKVKILAQKPAISHRGVKALLRPSYMDVHQITAKHKHIAFVFFASAQSARVRLHEREHADFAWVTEDDFKSRKFHLSKSIRFYCEQALKEAQRRKRKA